MNEIETCEDEYMMYYQSQLEEQERESLKEAALVSFLSGKNLSKKDLELLLEVYDEIASEAIQTREKISVKLKELQ
ncbi:hypothetical protein [Campylobacter devanensis]|uniref:hypothetical protein n=1 Tax=Campylobacter devanensis TaxID=3161138 RepID=UPI000A3453E1|nr:hypothetical protein [Campylobacter sp. P0227]